jgi:hypothetical protein
MEATPILTTLLGLGEGILLTGKEKYNYEKEYNEEINLPISKTRPEEKIFTN